MSITYDLNSFWEIVGSTTRSFIDKINVVHLDTKCPTNSSRPSQQKKEINSSWTWEKEKLARNFTGEINVIHLEIKCPNKQQQPRTIKKRRDKQQQNKWQKLTRLLSSTTQTEIETSRRKPGEGSLYSNAQSSENRLEKKLQIKRKGSKSLSSSNVTAW